MSTPIIPPRPQRTQTSPSPPKNESPIIPPRPMRQIDPSPDREASTRSPLNNPPTALNTTRQVRPRTSQDLPRRPPSVSLPDVGREGEEYSSFDRLPDEARLPSASEQTRNVSADLPMHQPIASVPQSTAKRQIENVTRTDSAQAAAAGIGRADDAPKVSTGDAAGHSSPVGRPSTDPLLRTKPSFTRSSSSLQHGDRAHSRPASVHGDDHEHGIPEIGQQVPLLHMAGDVQAPTPVSGQPQHARGIGFFNDGSTRAHVRKRSSRQEFGPPDSYGLHHDRPDQLEKEWIRKHPEEAAKEGHYNHLPRPETALTSEQLNRLVHQSDASNAGSLGNLDNYMAEEYLERLSSAAPSPAPDRKPVGHADPLVRGTSQSRLRPEDALPAPDDDHHRSGTPILAEDEILKRPSSAYMHAAVLPDPDSHPDEHYDSDTGRNSRRNSLQQTSSRPNSTHGTSTLGGYSGGSLHRFISHEEPHHSGHGTPLEEIEEYEPLFPEDDKNASPRKVFKKRPELAQHHFPSSDVWEDSPSSLQYSTTVSTPDLERTMESLDHDKAAATFETPEEEQRRRSQNDRHHAMTSDSKTLIKPRFKAGVAEEIHRPGSHRFPSSDVWEDSPDSYTLVNQTTVGEAAVENATAAADDEEDEPPAGRPAIPARPLRKPKPAAGDENTGALEVAAATKAKPPIPARPGGEKIAAMKAGFMNDLNNRLKLGPSVSPPKKEADPEAHEEEARAPLADARKTRAKGPTRRKPATSPSNDRKSSIAFAFSPLIHCWSIDEEDELQVHDAGEKNKENVSPDTVVEKVLGANAAHNADSAAPAKDIAASVSNADKPQDVASQHGISESDLKAALSDVGAAPQSFAEE